MSDAERRFDEEQVGLILKRVAELHERNRDLQGARAMTQAELEGVVGELGISKALVRRAVADVALADSRHQHVWWLGGKTDLLYEERLEHGLSESAHEHIFEILRRHLADIGEVRREGKSVMWFSSQRTARTITFTIFDADPGTVLRLEERMPNQAKANVGGGASVGGAGGFMMSVPVKLLFGKAAMAMALPALVVGGVAAGWMAGRAIWRRKSDSREGQLAGAFSEILLVAEAENEKS